VEAVVEQIQVNERPAVSSELSEESRAAVERYLRACPLPEPARARIISTIQTRLQHEPTLDPLHAAIEEAQRAISLPPLVPQRPPETHPMTMETSLDRLPSFRMIAGWFVLIALIVLAFIFTR
jgi:hypothetical protein